MKRFNKIIAVVALAAAPAVASAIPAPPFAHKVTQPDGTVLEIRLVGDENGHFMVTADDNMPVVKTAEGFFFATENNLSSGILAANAASRNAAQLGFAASFDRAAFDRTISDNFAATMARRYPQNVAARVPEPEDMLINHTYPTSGKLNGLVILVDFPDKKFSVEDPVAFFNDHMNKDGHNANGATGSAAEYYRAASFGKLDIKFDVYGPVTLPNSFKYYGQNDRSGMDRYAYLMAVHAGQLLDEEVDFSPYDQDGDGEVDNVTIIYAGEGEATAYPTDPDAEDYVWPHSYDIEYSKLDPADITFDGVKFNHYICMNEWDRANSRTPRPAGIGLFCHEFGHALGLPDLYMTSYSGDMSATPGQWSIMDQGSYNNGMHTPPLMSSYERYTLGWVSPIVIDKPMDAELKANSGKCYVVETDRANEFFMFECRTKDDDSNVWDSYLKASGLMVWHIDFSKRNWTYNNLNNDAKHQRIDLVEADGSYGPYSYSGDLFPGANDLYTEFTAETYPAFLSWNEVDPGFPLTEIAYDKATHTVTFKVAGGGEKDGIADIDADNNNAPVEYFNLQGRRVAEPKAGDIVIRRQGTDVTKVIL